MSSSLASGKLRLGVGVCAVSGAAYTVLEGGGRLLGISRGATPTHFFIVKGLVFKESYGEETENLWPKGSHG